MRYLTLIIIISSLFISLNCSFQATLFNKINKEKEGENLIISPLSIYQALSLAANGAKGKTLSEMLDTLENESLEELNKINLEIISIINQFSTIDIANAVMTKFTPLENFTKVLEQYLAPIEPLINVEQVNNWCSNKTHGKINKILDQLDPDAYMLILNAVYFKGVWSSKFKKSSTRQLPFYNFGTEEIKIDTMDQIEHFSYYGDKNVQAIRLPFNKDSMSAIIILPSKGTDINKFINGLFLSNNEYNKIIEGLKYSKVHLQLPKFEVNFEKELNDILIDLGMYSAFNVDADFSGLRKEGELYISKVIHKTYLKVNEEGTEAAAVTIVKVVESAMPEEDKIYNMKVNRPFLFMLKNKRLPEDHDMVFMAKIEKIE